LNILYHNPQANEHVPNNLIFSLQHKFWSIKINHKNTVMCLFINSYVLSNFKKCHLKH
jgi:hypothetical protein